MSNSSSPLPSILSSSSLARPRLLLILFSRQWPTLAQSRPRLATNNIGPASLDVSKTTRVISCQVNIAQTVPNSGGDCAFLGPCQHWERLYKSKKKLPPRSHFNKQQGSSETFQIQSFNLISVLRADLIHKICWSTPTSPLLSVLVCRPGRSAGCRPSPWIPTWGLWTCCSTRQTSGTSWGSGVEAGEWQDFSLLCLCVSLCLLSAEQ